ncbi:unnamed protein product, partial [Effrenium voratum]
VPLPQPMSFYGQDYNSAGALRGRRKTCDRVADGLCPKPSTVSASVEELLCDGAVRAQTSLQVFVGSNGYVTFGQPSSNRTGDLDSHFARPGFSALAHDLAPHKPVATVWLEVERPGTSVAQGGAVQLMAKKL